MNSLGHYTRVVSIRAPVRERIRPASTSAFGATFQSALPCGSECVPASGCEPLVVSIRAPVRERIRSV